MSAADCNTASNERREGTAPIDKSAQPSAQLASDGPAIDVVAGVLSARRQLQAAPVRDELGRWTTAGAGALGPGVRSRQLQERLAPLRDAVSDQALTDQGFTRQDAPQTVLMATRDLATLEVIGETLWAYLQERGCVTAKGRTSAALAKLLAVLDRKAKLISVLGLERKPRPVGTLAEAMREDSSRA